MAAQPRAGDRAVNDYDQRPAFRSSMSWRTYSPWGPVGLASLVLVGDGLGAAVVRLRFRLRVRGVSVRLDVVEALG
jgi:hypothetical protein